MNEEIIKTALLNPSVIHDVLESGILGCNEGLHAVKLEEVYQIYLKEKRMPSKAILNDEFNINLDDYNPADTEWLYEKLREHNKGYFDLAVRDLSELSYPLHPITPEKIHELEKKYIKDYGNKAENRFLITSPEDVKLLRDRIKQKEDKYLETGFPSLNELTKGSNQEGSGGWHPKAIYTVLGLSGYGKSIVLTNFARDIWEKAQNVLYISTEMDQDDTFERILKSKYKAKNMDEVLLKMESSPFPSTKIEVIKVHPNDTSCDDIQQMIDNLDWKPDILFIDYADELKCHEAANNEYEAQGIVYAGLKKLSEINNVPVITATQTNRDAEDKDKGGTKEYVGYSTVADSSKKIRLVDMLFSITQSTHEKSVGVLNLIALKNRFGESNKRISFSINYQTMRLDEIPQKVEVQTIPDPLPCSESKTVTVELNRRGKI